MEIETDSQGNRYIEVPFAAPGERIRITHVIESWSGDRGIRIQVRDENGHLRQGPEFEAERIGDVVSAALVLLTQTE